MIVFCRRFFPATTGGSIVIKKNRQGRVVEFVDESVLPSGQARAARSATRVADPQSEALPANRDEIFARYEAAVKEVTQAAEAAAKTELEQLAAQVAGLDAVARKAREVARMKLRSDEAEAEGVRRETAAKARAECEARLDGIRADFHAALVPINAEVALARARQEAALRGAVRACADLRDEQLAALAEAERLDAKVDMVTEDYTNAPARTAG